MAEASETLATCVATPLRSWTVAVVSCLRPGECGRSRAGSDRRGRGRGRIRHGSVISVQELRKLRSPAQLPGRIHLPASSVTDE